MGKCNIKCEWMKGYRAIINPDGQVIPCCYFANPIAMMQKFPDPAEVEPIDMDDKPIDKEIQYVEERASRMHRKQPILASYIRQADGMNLNNHTMEEIFDHPWFQELYDSWEDSDKVSSLCVKRCSDVSGE